MVASVNDTRAFRCPRADTDPALRRCRSRGIFSNHTAAQTPGRFQGDPIYDAIVTPRGAHCANCNCDCDCNFAPCARDRFKLLLKHARANSTGKILQVARASQASAATAVGCLAAVDDVTSAMRSCQ